MRSLARVTRLCLTLLILMAAAGVGLSPSAVTAAPSFKGEAIPNRYIVTLRPGVAPQSKATALVRGEGMGLFHVYDAALHGFAATLPLGLVNRLRLDPDVVSIVEDRTVAAFADTLPTGVRRVEADRNGLARIGSGANPVDVDVAVIDTGIDLDHPDLRVVGGVSCVPGDPSYDDANGHGTHVAGTIGALDNGSGVVGVAPGARLWAVRVLNANGEGAFSDVMCGIDWVTAHADTIKVANMSLGATGSVGNCDDGGLHQAVCDSVAAGVTYVVAAGNDGADAGGYVPAAYDEVITVSAIVDTDGQPGGTGPYAFFYGADDSLASFSNRGAVVDLAAPGFNIRSTWIGGSYAYESGTSMASPHVAGAAALYLMANPGASPAAVRAGLQAVAWDQGSAEGFSGDTDGNAERLLNVGAIGGDPLPPPAPSCVASVDQGPVSTPVSLACANLPSGQSVKVYWDDPSTRALRTFTARTDGSGAASFSVPTTPGGAHTIVAQSAGGVAVDIPFTVTPSLRLTSSSGSVGTRASAYLKGFAAGEVVELRWTGQGMDRSLVRVAVADNGTLTTSLVVPEATRGDYTVVATGQTSQTADAGSYSVIPALKLSPTAGRVGSSTTATLTGFASGETITLGWADGVGSTSIVAVSPLGSGTQVLTIPAASKGQHVVTATGDAGSSASDDYTVTSSLTVSATSGLVDDPLTISLRGYGASESVTLNWYDTSSSAHTLATGTTGADGSLDLTVTVPDATRGSHKITASGAGSGASGSVYFSVDDNLTLSPSSGPAGTTVSVALSGFRAAESVSIKWYRTSISSTVVATTTVSATGSGTASFVVPQSAAGSYKVEAASASGLRASMTFTVAP